MSEVQTSPAPAEAAPAADAGVVESPAPSGEMTEQPMEELSSAPEEKTTEESPDERPEPWDHTTWDGNLDNLPEHLQAPVRFLHKNLESGYTKKFQSLAEERKAFDADRKKWEEENISWKTDKDKTMAELDILRALYRGKEDPRIAQYQGQFDEQEEKFKAMQQEYNDFRAHVEKDIERQAQDYAKKFRAENKAIFDNDEKRAVLAQFMDDGWSPEDAVKLIDVDKKVVELAGQLKSRGVPPEVAVEHAMMKIGTAVSRKPRPGAQLTSGARSQNNPASTNRSINSAGNSREARLMAAREAVNWRSKTKL